MILPNALLDQCSLTFCMNVRLVVKHLETPQKFSVWDYLLRQCKAIRLCGDL